MNSLGLIKKWKPSLRVLFIDDGGVLNDNRRRGPEWLRLIGEFMPSRLGGTSKEWIAANREVFHPLWSELQQRLSCCRSYLEFRREYDIEWLGRMCDYVDVDAPSDDLAIALSREAAIYVARHATADIEGAAHAVKTIRDSGYLVHTASGTPSWELDAILSKMGIRQAIGNLFGPDIVDHVKHGPEFYARLFAHVNVQPSECLVVESSQECCRWAVEAGARSVWVDCEQGGTPSLEEIAETLVG